MMQQNNRYCNVDTIQRVRLFITSLERFYGMDSLEMREAFAEWLEQWMIQLFGDRPDNENKYYRRFAEYIKVTYPTVDSWLNKRSFPKEARIAQMCELRGITIGKFWAELQSINDDLRLKNGIKSKPVNVQIDSAEQLLGLVEQLNDIEKARFANLILDKLRSALMN